jgi:glycosyltransferase involved in cell wall biosynthesis
MGGAEVVVRLLADNLLASGHDVLVFSYSADGHEEIFGDFPRERLLFQKSRSLTATLAERDFDVVHATTWASAGGLLDAANKARFRGSVIVTCHGTYVPHPNDSRANILTAVSMATARRVRPHVTQEVEVVYNGIDLDLFRPVECEPQTRPVILWVGRPHDLNKDISGFAALVGSLARYDLSFTVVSADNDERAVSVGEWFTGNVEVLRHVPRAELPAIYSAAAASGGMLVSTSISEGMPLCVLEAMACGCPVVAPDVGGISEAVTDESTGLLYSRRDGIESLSRRVLELADDAPMRERITRSAIEQVSSRFSAQAMTARYLTLYDQAMSSQRAYSAIDKAWRAMLPVGIRTMKAMRRISR